MLLRSITLNNIRSYNQQKIMFPEGSILLSGDIGVGKSSILLAIEFALFGIQRDSFAGDMLLRKGASSGFVELDLQLGDMSITIHRLLKRGNQGVKQDAGFIIMNGKRQDATPTELKSIIVELLGYPKEMITKSTSLLYRYTVYTPQEEMKLILQEQRATRLDTLRRLFHIDKYQRIANNTIIYARSIREECRELDGKISDLPQLLLQLKDLHEAALRLRSQFQECKQQCHHQETIVAESTQALRLLEEKQQKYLLLQQQLELIKSSLLQKQQLLQDYQQELTAISDQQERLDVALASIIIPKNLAFQDLQQQVHDEERQYTTSLQRHAEATTTLTMLSSQLIDLHREITKKTEEHDHLSKERQNIEGKLNLLNQVTEQDDTAMAKKVQEVLQERLLEKKGLETQCSQVANVQHTLATMDQCPTCFQPVSEHYKEAIVAAQTKKMDEFLSRVKECEYDITELRYRLHYADATTFSLFTSHAILQQHQLICQHLSAVQDELRQLRQKQMRIQEEREAGQQVLDEFKPPTLEDQRHLEEKKNLLSIIVKRDALLQSHHEKIQRYEEIHKRCSIILKEMNLLSSSAEGLAVHLAAFSLLSEEMRKAKAQLDTVVQTLQQYRILHATLLKEVEIVQQRQKEVTDDITKKQAVQHRLVQLRQFSGWLDTAFVPLLATIEKHVLGRVYHEFNALFQRWFSMLMGDEQIMVKLDDSFSPVIEQNGHDMSVESLSGGEKTAVALAYRLALNRVVNDIITTIKTRDIIILDEPTDGFSTEQLDLLRDVLLQLGTRQTILVSHETKMEGFVDHVIRLQKDEHTTNVMAN